MIIHSIAYLVYILLENYEDNLLSDYKKLTSISFLNGWKHPMLKLDGTKMYNGQLNWFRRNMGIMSRDIR